jgi:cytochrome P450
VLNFDHHSTEFAEDWREQYAELRAACPVARTEAFGGFTVLTRYDDVKRALLTPADFACGRDLQIDGVEGSIDGGVTIPTNPFRMGMMEMDPPTSLKFRKLLVPWFSVRSVEVNAAHIRDLVTWCLDRVIESGQMDIVDDLANPLPALVTLDLMGLPLENWEQYAQILHQAAYRAKGSAKQIAWLLTDLRAIVESRRETPAAVPTPLDALLVAEVDGERLSIDLVVELVFMLLNGGIDTSTALIAHIVRYLGAHPVAMAELRADPSLIPAAVDEFLRYFTPGTGLARTAIRDTTVGETEIKAGERVFLALGSANTDPAEFDRADTVDLSRDANRHLAFGAGVHRCVGSFLAPREIAIVLEELLRRAPDLTVDESGVEAYPSIPLVAGFKSMPARFSPGPRIGRIETSAVPPSRGERELANAANLAAEDAEEPDLVELIRRR